MQFSPMLRGALVALTMSVFGLASNSFAAEWSLYTDRSLNFSIQLPTGEFRATEQKPGRLVLQGARGAQIEVFGGRNERDLSPAKFRALVEAADPAREITYRAAGPSWFVLSGYMPGETGQVELIFYAKFMFDRIRQTFSAFEITYPADLKREYDATVSRMEKTLRAPGSI